MRNNYKPYKMRWEVFIRDNFTCQYCGQSAPNVILTVDHKKPVSAGGDDSLENLITACQACNLGKSDSLPPQWSIYSLERKRRGRPPQEPSIQWRVSSYLNRCGEATATQIAKSLQCSRPFVSSLLNRDPRFIRVRRQTQEGTFYKLVESVRLSKTSGQPS